MRMVQSTSLSDNFPSACFSRIYGIILCGGSLFILMLVFDVSHKEVLIARSHTLKQNEVTKKLWYNVQKYINCHTCYFANIVL